MTKHPPRPRIYLAGPDLFMPDCAQRYERLKAECDQQGLCALAPSDADVPVDFNGSDDERAQHICAANLEWIRNADAVLANLCSFRGLEPDSGTVFEVGYAVALGKPVAAYGVPEGTYASRVAAARICTSDAQGVLRERDTGTLVEGLGQRLNLMLTGSMVLHDSSARAAAWLSRALRSPGGAVDSAAHLR